MTRREFLVVGSGVGTALTLGGPMLHRTEQIAWAQQPIPSKEDMIVHSINPSILETKLTYLKSFVTPNKHFYVRSQYPTPTIDLSRWQLSIEGEVERSLRLKFDDVKQFEEVTLTTWLQCFGNGRSFFAPRATGTPWKYGSIGQAIWKGLRLRDLLLRTGLKTGAKHLVSQGYDDPPEGAEPFLRSIPLEKALDPNTLLVYEMNGEPLPLLHGYPLRLLVPGWGGSAQVKWLKRMIVSKEEWPGCFMQQSYRVPVIPTEPGARIDQKDMVAATRQPVNSFFTSHTGGETLKTGEILLTGAAYSGETGIDRVEISVDGGKTWQRATITQPAPGTPPTQALGMWHHWEYRWRATNGKHTLVCRARDWLGRTQPTHQRDIPWNPLGYNYNAVQNIEVTIE